MRRQFKLAGSAGGQARRSGMLPRLAPIGQPHSAPFDSSGNYKGPNRKSEHSAFSVPTRVSVDDGCIRVFDQCIYVL